MPDRGVQGHRQDSPLILVAGKAPDADCKKGNWTPYFAQTTAYRSDLTKSWERTTCAAGHYAWPLDEDGDGRAEAVFVGKYLLRPDGTVRCVLPGFGTDHLDSMVVASSSSECYPSRRSHHGPRLLVG